MGAWMQGPRVQGYIYTGITGPWVHGALGQREHGAMGTRNQGEGGGMGGFWSQRNIGDPSPEPKIPIFRLS